MIDQDLANLYEVETKVLNQAVKRNIDRFPDEFMFQLNEEEFKNLKPQTVTSNQSKALRSQFVTLKQGKHRKYIPHVFTEHGILMLSSVLNNKRAIQVNIQIMKTFMKLRKLMIEHQDLHSKIEKMENKYDHQFKIVFDAIKRLINPPEPPKKSIGFHVK
ncbi:hypothetical protein MNBD_UNCLBAC01-1314 [hydrothermal vent metagenome]|uniref:KilA-N DNA-binding domain-containing protein n=1 Tax=hydrothermal vent metagenome TaxID=652676 RepID=A0A3B1DPA7_9ZZZZ